MSTIKRLSNEDLKQLLPLCINKDEAAWETVFHGLYGLVKCVVLKVMRERAYDDEVDDAVADAFRNVVDSIAEVSEAQNPLGYIGAIARNAALSRVRRVTLVATREQSWSGGDEDDGAGTDIFQTLGAADEPRQGMSIMTRQIERELDRLRTALPEEDRNLLRLKYGVDLTYDEIAYIMGKESGALRVAIHRVVKGLRNALDADIRKSVQQDPRLFGELVGMNLNATAPAVDPDDRMQRLLEDYVDDDSLMSPADRQEVEAALAASSAMRERKVMLERHLNSVEYDVVGHCAEVPEMPQNMLKTLMERAMTAPNAEPMI